VEVKELLSVWVQLPVVAPRQPSWAAQSELTAELPADGDSHRAWRQQAHEASLATPLLAFCEKMKTPQRVNRFILSKSL
jgi:hypothetical protein